LVLVGVIIVFLVLLHFLLVGMKNIVNLCTFNVLLSLCRLYLVVIFTVISAVLYSFQDRVGLIEWM